jgi:hypothetical protein
MKGDMIADPHEFLSASAQELTEMLASWLETLPVSKLPARLCCSRSGLIDPNDWSFSVLDTEIDGNCITARVGFFFTEIVGGCNCDDDPSRFNDYCDLIIEINGAAKTLRWRDLGTGMQ